MTYIKEWFTWYHELIWKVFKEENSSQTNPNVHCTLILESRSENFQYCNTEYFRWHTWGYHKIITLILFIGILMTIGGFLLPIEVQEGQNGACTSLGLVLGGCILSWVVAGFPKRKMKEAIFFKKHTGSGWGHSVLP